MPASHVFEDLMQLTHWVQDATSPIATSEHARHVIESAYAAAETIRTREPQTTFSPS